VLLDSRTRGRPALTRSRAERILRDLTRKAQLPPAELNVTLHGFRVDALWREHRVVVEVDGYEFRARRANFESDRRRDAILEAHARTVIRITARRLEDEPYAVVARVACPGEPPRGLNPPAPPARPSLRQVQRTLELRVAVPADLVEPVGPQGGVAVGVEAIGAEHRVPGLDRGQRLAHGRLVVALSPE
jgi:very-short-patch-repair endonuclease